MLPLTSVDHSVLCGRMASDTIVKLSCHLLCARYFIGRIGWTELCTNVWGVQVAPQRYARQTMEEEGIQWGESLEGVHEDVLTEATCPAHRMTRIYRRRCLPV